VPVPVGVGEGGGAVDRVGAGVGACVGTWVWLRLGAVEGDGDGDEDGLAAWVTGATAGAVPKSAGADDAGLLCVVDGTAGWVREDVRTCAE
jgi:hypothetical protein